MGLRRAKTNRKPIAISRTEPNAPTGSCKDQFIHQFDADFHSNLQNYIEMERTKLKNLDKAVAKRVVSAAESSLLHFLKSRAKINCLRTQQNVHPFHLVQQQKKHQKQVLFDDNKLQYEIEKEQKYKKVKQVDYSPLFERCMRQTAEMAQNRLTHIIDKKQPAKKQKDYIPLSVKHRLKKFIF